MMEFPPPNHDEMAFVVVAIQCSQRNVLTLNPRHKMLDGLPSA